MRSVLIFVLAILLASCASMTPEEERQWGYALQNWNPPKKQRINCISQDIGNGQVRTVCNE